MGAEREVEHDKVRQSVFAPRDESAMQLRRIECGIGPDDIRKEFFAGRIEDRQSDRIPELESIHQ